MPAGGVDPDVPSRSSGETPGDEEVARAVAKRLITEEQVHAIVGCHPEHADGEIVAEVCEEYHIPMITAILSTVAAFPPITMSIFPSVPP